MKPREKFVRWHCFRGERKGGVEKHRWTRFRSLWCGFAPYLVVALALPALLDVAAALVDLLCVRADGVNASLARRVPGRVHYLRAWMVLEELVLGGPLVLVGLAVEDFRRV